MSDIMDGPLQLLSSAVRAVTIGVEIGALMRGLPTQAHRNLALRNLDDSDPISLMQLLEELGESRLKLAASFKEETLIDKTPLVFPLLSAIRSGEGTGLSVDIPRQLSEWTARALLERSILRFQYKDKREI